MFSGEKRNLQTVFRLDPFDSIYYAASRNRVDYIITRELEFVKIVNSAENRKFAVTPEEFLKIVEKKG